MKHRVTAAFVGALIAAPCITACSDNTSQETEETTTEKATTTAKAAKKTDKNEVAFTDLGVQTEVNPQNRFQVLFVMDDGSYVYPMAKNVSDSPVVTYVCNKNDKTEELKLPENSVVYYSDGKKLYYYSPDEGLCEYNDGKSTALNKATKNENGDIPERDSFLFTKDNIYFASTDDEGTEIRSMDYSGKLTDSSYFIDKKNARLVGIADMDGGTNMVCGYSIGTSEVIVIVASDGSSEEISSGSNAYISGDDVYYIRLAQLYRKPLGGGDEVRVTDEKCVDYCFSGDKLFFADAANVYALDKDGKAKKIFSVDKMTKCGCISHISSVGDKLFVKGVEAAFWSCIAEIDRDGKLIKEYQNGIER